jgi:uncharacterized membrane protein YidH (DUF202 family)
MTPADDIEDADPGLARARTALSWTRTAISFAALGAVILKSRPYAGISILSGLIWGLGQLTRGPATARAQSRRLRLIALAILGVSIVALAIALTGG